MDPVSRPHLYTTLHPHFTRGQYSVFIPQHTIRKPNNCAMGDLLSTMRPAVRGGTSPVARPRVHLLTLPAKLRLLIYACALSSSDEIEIPVHGKTPLPALLWTNRRFRHQAAETYYAHNSFAISILDRNIANALQFASRQVRTSARSRRASFACMYRSRQCQNQDRSVDTMV